MRNNRRRFETDESVGPIRQGKGLLSGLLRCGRCGRKLHVRYQGKSGTSPRYLCMGDYESGGQYCLGAGGRGLDARVAAEVLEALSPMGSGPLPRSRGPLLRLPVTGCTGPHGGSLARPEPTAAQGPA